MSKSSSVIQFLQARLEKAISRRRENPSRADILMIPALALALDACGGGGSQRPTPPPPPPPPPPNAIITADAEGSVDENADGGTVISVSTENANEVTVDDDRFEVADGNLKLKAGTSLDFESDTSPIEVTITASGDGESATQAVTVSINDVNEAPSITVTAETTAEAEAAGVSPTLMVAEDSDGSIPGAVLALIGLSDPDAGDTHTLEVSDDRFEIIDAFDRKWLKLKEGAHLDFETEETIAVTITVTDAGGLAASADVTVTVNDVDEAPSAPEVRDGPFSLTENDEGAVVTSLSDSTDPEGDDITYSVDDERFEITSSLVLKLKDGMYLNHEDGASVDLTLSASDPAGNTSTSVVTVEVTNVNEAPSITVTAETTAEAEAAGVSPTLMVAEDSDGSIPGAVLALIGLSDPDAGDTHTLEVSDDRFEIIDAFDRKWLKLKEGVGLDYEAEDSIAVTVTVTDADGLSDSAEVTVAVNDVNEAPSVTITGGATVPVLDVESSLTVAENAMGADLPPLALIEISDPDAADAAMLTGRDGMMATSVDNDHFEVKLDPEGGLWLALKAEASLDHEAATDGTIDVTVTFTDSAGNTGSAVATVIVTDLNEAPSVTVQDGTTPDGMEASSSVSENAAGALVGEITVEDPDDGDTWTLSVDENSDFEVKQDSEGGWWLKLKDDVSLDYEDAASVTVTVTVTDSQGAEGSTDVTVTVVNIEEAPSTPVLRTANPSVDENDAGASVSVVDSEDPQGDEITFNVSDSRFEVVDGLLKLKDGMSLDHEAEDEVTLTVTATDGTHTSAAAAVTITVNDINEAPDVTGSVANVTANAGDSIKADPIDLLALFSDPDDGDTIASYEMSGNPSWLTFSVEYGTDENGDRTAHGILTGDTPSGDDSINTVTITASDSAGNASASVSFLVISDDGNDDITAVNLLDADGNITREAEVDENDASGVWLAQIEVEDQDHDSHPYGKHQIEILRGVTTSADPDAPVDSRFEVKHDDAGNPWLVLKEGESLDFEGDEGAVEVTIRAVDLDGATHPPSRGGGFMGNVEHATVTVLINDLNDAPEAQTIGNWWVTTEEGQRSSDIQKGEWLTFNLEEEPDAKPAFKDPDGDTLTYSLSGPSFLEIDEDTGRITNTKGGVPLLGDHMVTVTATDPDGESASATFQLAVGFSDAGTGNAYTEDNEAPRFGSPSRSDYLENSGERRVATFTVTDDDNSLGHHPFALDSVRITAVESGDSGEGAGEASANPLNATLVDHDSNDQTPMIFQTATPATNGAGFGAAFRLSEPRKSGNTWTYDLYVRDTNPSPLVDTTELLDHEDDGSINITITANDGTAAPVTEVINIRIADVNDKPVAEGIGDNPATPTPETTFNIEVGTYGVEQSETLKEVLYIKLEDIWSDQEDQPGQMSYGASVSGSWITILHGPADWSDIDDDVDWNDNDFGDTGTPNRTVVIVGDDTTEPGSSEQVLIIELDRTLRNNGQDAEASFTLTATDRDGGTSSKTYKIPVTDENLPPSNAVTLRGSAREDATLRATFNDDRDPDLAGSATPALVIYQWFTADDDAGTNEALVSQGTSSTFRLTQSHVGDYITVKVKYYEVGAGTNAGQLVGLDVATVDNEATTSRAVSNTPDKGVGAITVTADTNVLSVLGANVSVTDGDYVTDTNRTGAVPGTALSYSWEVSDNGRGGWTAVDQGTDTDTSTLELEDGDGDSKFYRAVVTYNANNDDDNDPATTEETESVYSLAVHVSDIRDATVAVPVPTGNAFAGGTLSVDVRNTSVKWQRDADPTAGVRWVDIPGATGDLALTQAHAGASVRAVVSYDSTDPDNPGVTAIVTTAPQTVGGTAATPATPVAVDDDETTASVTGTGHGPRGVVGVLNQPSNNAGHNLSVTHTFDLASLFQDPDSTRLTFTAAADSGSNLGANTGSGTTYVFEAAAGGVLVFEADTGVLNFDSDVYQGHDGDSADGGGNLLTLNITATDEGNRASTTTADVSLRINVAPKDIFFAATTGTAATATDGTTTVGTATTFVVTNVSEHVGPAAAGSNGQLVAHVNVQDENAGTHEFGTHDVKLSGDDRFEITHTGYTAAANSRDTDRDGSTWEVRLKAGEKLDYETQVDMDPVTPGKQIVLTLTATDDGGLSTPSGPGINPITLTITLVDVDTAGGDRNHPPDPTPLDVPGFTDNDGTDNDEVNDGDDPDHDGGTQPPPPGMSLGGIIEDFIDNMDQGEQDLLEDYLLTIDDGLDIV